MDPYFGISVFIWKIDSHSYKIKDMYLLQPNLTSNTCRNAEIPTVPSERLDLSLNCDSFTIMTLTNSKSKLATKPNEVMTNIMRVCLLCPQQLSTLASIGRGPQPPNGAPSTPYQSAALGAMFPCCIMFDFAFCCRTCFRFPSIVIPYAP